MSALRIRLFSDLHFEHHVDKGQSFVDGLDPSGCDVLVIAGDLVNQDAGIILALTMLCRKFKNVPVVYVTGNHELYASDRGRLNNALRRAKEVNENLLCPQNETVNISGHRILSSTLWFPKTLLAVRQASHWSDFICIRGLDKWVYEENEKSVLFLRQNLQEGDIVVTHHLPTFSSVHPRFAGSLTNCYFVCDIEDLIKERKPRLMMHGHTHESMRYWIGGTEVACNPFGYVGFDQNPRFDEKLTIEIESSTL